MKKQHRSRKVFIENEGFRDELPLTKLAKGLMPKVELLSIEEVESMRGMNEEGERVYKVKLVYPWNKNNADKPFEEVRGISKDEIDAYQMLKKSLRDRGFSIDESSA